MDWRATDAARRGEACEIGDLINSANMDDWLWTWGGASFGFRDGESLFTHEGVEAGHFHGDEIYGSDGTYLGELRSDNKLITRLSILRASSAFAAVESSLATAITKVVIMNPWHPSSRTNYAWRERPLASRNNKPPGILASRRPTSH